MHEFENVDCDELKLLLRDPRFRLKEINKLPIRKKITLFPDFKEIYEANDYLVIARYLMESEEYQKIKNLKVKELNDLLGDECK